MSIPLRSKRRYIGVLPVDVTANTYENVDTKTDQEPKPKAKIGFQNGGYAFFLNKLGLGRNKELKKLQKTVCLATYILFRGRRGFFRVFLSVFGIDIFHVMAEYTNPLYGGKKEGAPPQRDWFQERQLDLIFGDFAALEVDPRPCYGFAKI